MPRCHSARAFGGLLLVGLLLALSAGCGKNYKTRGTVKGKVTIDGKSLTTGTVTFTHKEDPGYSASAPIGTDGVYHMPDAPVGPCNVTVKVGKLPMTGLKDMSKAPVGPVMPGEKAPTAGKIPKEVVPIPDRYAEANTSGLTFEVQKGEQEHNITLTAK
jgi:hypothetical protein